MFRPSNPQVSLLESRFLVPPEKQARLARSWAHVFLTRVMPLIGEECMRDCFDPGNGRPNKSIRLLMGVHLLKAWNDLTDEQVLENLEYNLQWQYALGIQADEAHLPQKTLHNFRARLLESGQGMAMFDGIARGLAELDGLSWSRQRLDSTHVMSDIAVLTRLGLFVETETLFLRELKAEYPEKVSSLGAAVVRRYLEREGYFADAKRDQAQRRLPVAAQDLLYLVRRFERDASVNGWESYRLMVRLLEEQCDVNGDAGEGGTGGEPSEKIALKNPKEIKGASLQSPHDPDATYGHKGKGYEVQVSETCVAENPYQIVTHVQINGAHESDQHATLPVVMRLAEKGMVPEELEADTGYGSGENIVACAVEGVRLVAPVQDPDAPTKVEHRWEPAVEQPAADPSAQNQEPPAEPGPLGLGDFRFDATFDEAVACPAGHAPVRQEVLDGSVPYKATFDGERCRGCPLEGRCPTRVVAKTGDRVLNWRDVTAATATRQLEQREPAFKEAYKIRSGVESTMEEFKGRHGGRDLRVRRRPQVELAAIFKTAAMNAKRAAQYHVERLQEALAGEPEASPVTG
ncbi:MAG: transposase [Actinobacteria bacterium]|nr:transposase [Actinomycetota bacterium]MBU1942179.1 transposase [Actinomycetota bacterium]MBU2687005.1 transposase [Actinomycetota bacterium]